MFIFGPKSIVLGYERVVNSHQSFAINIGHLEKKPFSTKEGEDINLFDHNDRGGFAFTGEYRFYFKKRNTKPAPDGLYWGPYAGYYGLNFDGKSKITDESGIESDIELNSKLRLMSVGVQLGYQFLIINDRFTIDLMLLGPSITNYKFELGLQTESSLDPESEYYDDVKRILDFLIPGSGIILDGQEFSGSGRLGFIKAGFRYGVQIGYHF